MVDYSTDVKKDENVVLVEYHSAAIFDALPIHGTATTMNKQPLARFVRITENNLPCVI